MKQQTNHDPCMTAHDFATIAEEFFQLNQENLDYQEICDTFTRVAKVKYCIFNLFDDERNSVMTVGISGTEKNISDVNRLFGLELKMRNWPRDLEMETRLDENTIVACTSMDLAGRHLPQSDLDLLITMFAIGETFIVNVVRNNVLLGEFLIFMDKGDSFQRHSEVVFFTRLLGKLLEQKRVKHTLEIGKTKLNDVIDFFPDATFAIDQDHRVTLWNKAIESLTGIDAKDILGKSDFEYALPFFGEARPLLIDLIHEKNPELEGIYIDFKREESHVSAQAFAKNLYSGKGAWVTVKASSLYDDEGKIVGAIEIIRDISAQKRTEQLLKDNEERFENLFRRAPLGYQSLDEEGRFIEVNEAWLSTLGYESIDVVGKWFGDFVADDFVEKFRERFPLFKAEGKIHSEFFMKHKNGTLKYIGFEGRIGYKADGSFQQTHCILQDITDKKRAEEKLIESEQTHKALFDFSGVGIGYYTTDGKIISYNSKAAEHMGGKPEEFIGRSVFELFSKEKAEIYLKRIQDSSQSDQAQNYEDCVPLPGGNLWFFSTFSRILDASGNVKGVQIISQDISELKNKEAKITYLSYHDQLTGLYNRRFFDEELLRLDTLRNYPLTLAMGDVNGLKMINDSFGHKAGDELLVRVAAAIRKACRQDDIIARVGGDEFLIILPRSDEQDAEKVIQRINKFISLEKVGLLDISVSFGYETKKSVHEDMELIVKKTEDHMYRHKLNESSSSRNQAINLIMNTLFEKNKREKEHSDRVSQICVVIASAMHLEINKINHIRTAGLMHDIGKIGIDENILNSEIILTNSEWKEIRKHPEIGFRILNSAPEFTYIAEDIFSHHERWDGKGYPRGLKEEEISIFARIISIADAYDAMISERPYRKYNKSMSSADAVLEIKKNAGTQFDPVIARVFVEKVMNYKW